MTDLSHGLALEAAQQVVLQQAYRRNGDMLVCDPGTLDTPLAKLLDHETEIESLMTQVSPEEREMLERAVQQKLDDLLIEVRRRTLIVLFDWLCGETPLPRKILKRFYAFARVVSPDHISRMNQSEIGKLLGESRAAVCEREKQEVEAFFRLWMQTTYTASGGKSSAARDRFSREKKGNLSRKGGRKVEHLFDREHAEEEPERREITAEQLRAMEDAAECRRVAKLCGVNPEDLRADVLREPIPEEDEFRKDRKNKHTKQPE